MPADLFREHTLLYASFDDGPNADVARGDADASVKQLVVEHVPDAGRFGGAMRFFARDNAWDEDELTFAAKDNFPYSPDGFEGTIAMWLQGDPDADLHPDFPVDPFHISRHAADASFYLDLTKPNDWRYGSPRKLRFGFYNDSPANDMFQNGHLLVVGELNWNDGKWHHVVATWKNANSGEPNGEAAVYIDGKPRATMANYRHQLSWDLDQLTIGLGQRYVGLIDELVILDQALTTEQVAAWHQADVPISNWIDE